MRRKYLSFILIGGLALGLGLWLGRTQLLAWYYVHQLAQADDGNRDMWAGRVSDLNDSAVPFLIKFLGRDDDRACQNVASALHVLVARWGVDDPRTHSLVANLADAFGSMSPAGQEWVLMEQDWMGPENGISEEILQDISRILVATSTVNRPAVRAQALALADALVARHSLNAALLDACRELARAGLQDAEEASRLHAIRLAQAPGVDLFVEIVPRLRDPSAAVRRAAILALGPCPEVLNDDSLFYWLSDPDPEVRQLCEVALRGRGLQDHHIRLARLMADPRPTVRMQVLQALEQVEDLDPGVWLRRLSHDPAPAVRAAAARAAASQASVDLSDRIDQMAQTDPSPTVQQVARYYLSCQRLPRALSEK
jgi:HEAT repeat protein